MKDMDKAVSRIETAIANNENILIFGDYDVDGTTAVSLVSSYLRSFIQMWRRTFQTDITKVTAFPIWELTMPRTTLFP